jgi:branched-chain amino acid transport system substrate-binding protein
MICSQAGLPTQMASKAFQDAFKAKYGEVKQYAPFFYDGANILIAAMQKADSTDPAKYLPVMAKISYDGATGKIEFDEKGDRKDAEMTIFQMKGGNVEPVAIIKAGKTTKVGGDAPAAAAAPAAAPMAAPAAPMAAPAMAPAAPMAKDAPKK